MIMHFTTLHTLQLCIYSCIRGLGHLVFISYHILLSQGSWLDRLTLVFEV